MNFKKAVEISKSLRRHRIVTKEISSENKHVKDNDSENWRMTMSKILRLSLKTCFMQTTLLCFQYMSWKSLNFKREKFFGEKAKQDCHIECKYDWTSEIETISYWGEIKIQEGTKNLWRLIIVLTKKTLVDLRNLWKMDSKVSQRYYCRMSQNCTCFWQLTVLLREIK